MFMLLPFIARPRTLLWLASPSHTRSSENTKPAGFLYSCLSSRIVCYQLKQGSWCIAIYCSCCGSDTPHAQKSFIYSLPMIIDTACLYKQCYFGSPVQNQNEGPHSLHMFCGQLLWSKSMYIFHTFKAAAPSWSPASKGTLCSSCQYYSWQNNCTQLVCPSRYWHQ